MCNKVWIHDKYVESAGPEMLWKELGELGRNGTGRGAWMAGSGWNIFWYVSNDEQIYGASIGLSEGCL
jgi:hypothetical protein